MRNHITFICTAALTLTGWFASISCVNARPVKPPFANLDCNNYLAHVHQESDTNPRDTFNDYVYALARAGFKTAVFNVSSKQTNYESDVWDARWDGFDPEQGVDQPFFKTATDAEKEYWYPRIRQYFDFHKRGFDYPALAVELSRSNGISPWLSIRMNDVHHGYKKDHILHSSFYNNHPEFRRKSDHPYYSHALDYAHNEVRAHFLKLIRELLSRYDMDGLELDFMREPYVFSEGEEEAGALILNKWLETEVLPLVAAAGEKLGRKVLLGVRVPADPDTATALGLDVKTWIEKGYFDLLVPTPRWQTIEFDMPWNKWNIIRQGRDNPAILAGMETNYKPHPRLRVRSASRAMLFGAAASALAQGADGVYTFNYFPVDKRNFLHRTTGCGSLENLLKSKRTHAVTFDDIQLPGKNISCQLPFEKRTGIIRLSVAPIEKQSLLSLTIGLAAPAEQMPSMPELRLGEMKISIRPNKTREDEHIIAVGTISANEPIPAGELLLNVSWGDQKPSPIHRVELTISPPCTPRAPVTAAPQSLHGSTFDLVVIGATPAGIACAVRAAREGLKVLLVQHNRHLGGMLVNGLMQWDALYAGQRAPIFNQVASAFAAYYKKIYGEASSQYQITEFTQKRYPVARFEAKVAEHCLNRTVEAEFNLTTLPAHFPVDAMREQSRLTSLTLREYGTTKDITIHGRVFADCTYEGDLAAVSGVPYRIGREGRAETGEPHAGIVFTDIENKPGPQAVLEGRLNLRTFSHRQKSIDPNSPFSKDNAIQAYNYRFCLSADPANMRIPGMPPNYERNEYINYNRKDMGAGTLNGKGIFNNPILPGENHEYPEAEWPAREKITERHKNFALGLIYFLQNDTSVPEKKREQYRKIGLPRDEYLDNDNFPYEMYVREARRIEGRFLFKEQDNRLAPHLNRTPIFADSIGITDWPMDSHSCTTNTRPGFPYDGKLILTEESRPAQIPYRSILPRDVDNLLVPVCLSATHVAWGAVRLEPVWMQTGEAAGFAAALAIRHNTTPAELNPDLLIRTLVRNRFAVSFFNDADTATAAQWPAIQYLGTRGFFSGYDAAHREPLTRPVARIWADAFTQLHQAGYNPMKTARSIHAAELEKDDQPLSFSDFLTLLKHTHDSSNEKTITRGEACRLMFKILERESPEY